jgi:hypothetical protein
MYRTVHYRIVLLSMLHKIQAGWFMGAVLLECRMIITAPTRNRDIVISRSPKNIPEA